MITIAFANSKGGVGKTTAMVLFVRLLKALNYKLLLVDADEQCNLTETFFDKEEYLQTNVTDDAYKNFGYALTTKDIAKATVTVNDNIDILPAVLDMEDYYNVDTKRLKELLPRVESKYDFCLIDCPGTNNNLARNGLIAADLILTPVNLSLFAVRGTVKFLEKVTRVLENPPIKIFFSRVKFVLKDGNLDRRSEQYLDYAKKSFGESTLMNFYIPYTEQAVTAVDYGTPIKSTGPTAKLFLYVCSLVTETIGLEIPETLTHF